MWLPLEGPLLGTGLTTQACALMGNQTSYLVVHRPALNSLSHTSQGNFFIVSRSQKEHAYTKQNSLFIWNSNLTEQYCILGGIPTQKSKHLPSPWQPFGKLAPGTTWSLGSHICYNVILSCAYISLTGIGCLTIAASHRLGGSLSGAHSSSQLRPN